MPEVKSTIFEPFVSTKATEESLGLGLTITSSIVTKYGGSIGQEAGLNGGARFIVTFPDREKTRGV